MLMFELRTNLPYMRIAGQYSMRYSFVVLDLVVILLVYSHLAFAIFQFGDCPTLPDAAELESLIRETFRPGDSPPDAVIHVRDFNYVCLVPGLFRDTFRKLSVVVSYNCSVSTLCPSASPLSQFEFTCDTNEMWIDQLFGTSEFARTNVADASLTTPNGTNCSICIAPNHDVLLAGIPLPYDETTHCIGTYVSTRVIHVAIFRFMFSRVSRMIIRQDLYVIQDAMHNATRAV